LAKDVQLKMLRYQINPHFLFNVLNSIHALIDENKEKAKKLIVEMSEYYRYTLNKQEQTTSIEKEVEAIRKYLEILKIRFEEKFEYDISVDKAINSVLIPSFVIHLLIENAVKYGLQTNEQKLVIIGLKAKKSNNTLSINVSNSGKLLTSDNHTDNNINGTGNGIENIKNRLALFYKENYSFSLTEENGWVIATIEIKDIAS
jgi:LytS/YehU family sensor histidine kinase